MKVDIAKLQTLLEFHVQQFHLKFHLGKFHVQLPPFLDLLQKLPKTEMEVNLERYGFSQCIGAIDCIHIEIKRTKRALLHKRASRL